MAKVVRTIKTGDVVSDLFEMPETTYVPYILSSGAAGSPTLTLQLRDKDLSFGPDEGWVNTLVSSAVGSSRALMDLTAASSQVQGHPDVQFRWSLSGPLSGAALEIRMYIARG